MSLATVYIIADGFNTKIGITTDFDKRMASYVTHNPSARLFKSYSCSLEDAKRVELTIKTAFKDKLSSKSKEWFNVSHRTIDRYVSTLLYTSMEDEILPSMHGVKVTNDVHELLNKISIAIEKREKSDNFRKEVAEIFASKFNLGIPEHRLPEDVLIKDNLAVDLNHCNPSSFIAKEGIRSNLPKTSLDDHEYKFFHLNKLASGHYVAFCSSKVSMPYLEVIKTREDKDKVISSANDLGWNVTFHPDWSWCYPNKTALIIYQPKTPIANKLATFDKSFRKWVIERLEILKNEPYPDRKELEKVIEDIAYDNTFPLDINSFEELCERYLSPFFGIVAEDEYNDFLKSGYQYLFKKWEQ